VTASELEDEWFMYWWCGQSLCDRNFVPFRTIGNGVIDNNPKCMAVQMHI
jgi:hypothetical protein